MARDKQAIVRLRIASVERRRLRLLDALERARAIGKRAAWAEQSLRHVNALLAVWRMHQVTPRSE